MRKYSKGILGSFNDLIDTVVDSSRKGIDCMRSRPKKSKQVSDSIYIGATVIAKL
jgi:hypothetical protein